MAGFRTATRAFWVATLIAISCVASAETEPADDRPEMTDPAPEGAAEEAAETPGEPSEGEEAQEDIEDLVITARRRPELLQEVPVAATVLGGELLEQRDVNSLEGIGAYVPNLTAFSGAQHQGVYFSRGVGQGDSIVTLDPGVGIYVDDVYFARGKGALLPTLDLERIEVLRGPQGTLYGKNTIGGAIKLVSQKPGPTPYVAGSLGGGNYETIKGRATLNLPLIDDLLYSRFAFAGLDNEGYNENFINGDRHDDDNLKAFRGQLRLLPHEYVTLDLAGHYTSQVENSRGAKCRITNPALLGAFPASINFFNQCFQAQNANTFRFASELGNHYYLDTYGGSLVAAWEGGPTFGFLDSLDLKSVTALQEQQVKEGFLDIDATAHPAARLFTVTVDTQRQTQGSQELQAVAAALDDRLRLTTGLYGFWEDTGGGDVLTSTFGNGRQERVRIDNASYAIYGQASVTPLRWLELTGGLRETWEEKRAERTIVRGASPGELPEERADDSFSQLTPMAGLSLKAPAELIEDTPFGSGVLYFTYSQGYKSGGFATRRNPALFRISEFDSEELDNYELGFKLDLLDRRVLFNTAFFYSKYEDIQLTVLRVNPNSPAFRPDAGSTIANAGKATIQGFELELMTRPWRELVVRGSVGVTDAEYDEFLDQTWDISPGGLVTNIRPRDRSNETFMNVPELSLDGSVEYPIELSHLGLPDLGTLTPLVHVYYQTETDYHITAEGYASRRFRQDAYTLVDLRLIWDLWDDRTQVTLFADNLTDEHYFDSAIDVTNALGMGSVYYSAPRMYGAEISYRWHSPSFLEF